MTEEAPAASARHTVAFRNMQVWGLALDVLTELHRRAIPVIVLKSLPQIEDLYGDAAGRNTSDVDLVVHAEQVQETLDILRELGWRMLERHIFNLLAAARGPDAAARSRPWHCQPAPPLHGSLIDLHSDGMDPRWNPTLDGGIWERATAASSDEIDYLVLSPEDRLLFLCHHFLKESAWDVVPWRKLTDIELALRRGAELDWTYLGRRARQTGTTILLRLVCELAASRARGALQPFWRSVPVASRWRYGLLRSLVCRDLGRFGHRTRSLITALSHDRPRLVLVLLQEIFIPSRLTIAVNYTGAWPSWPRYLATLATISVRRLRAIAHLG